MKEYFNYIPQLWLNTTDIVCYTLKRKKNYEVM